MNALLAGPTAAEAGDRRSSTAIPDGTTLLGVTIKNGVATVDLSTEFDSGGGTASMQYRLAQVVYTLTQFTTVKSVVFQIEGETVTVFGSEGIVLDGPVGRADYTTSCRRSSSTGRPTARRFGNPGHGRRQRQRVRGDVPGRDPRRRGQDARRRAGHGDVRHRLPRARSTSRSRYTVSKAQWGTLRAYDPSAKDGSPEDIRDYPVWLTPKR